MKKRYQFSIICLLFLVLTSCSNISDKEKIPDMSTGSIEVNDFKHNDNKDEFVELSDTNIIVGGVEFSIPTYYMALDPNESNELFFESKNKAATLIFQWADVEKDISMEEFDNATEKTINNVAGKGMLTESSDILIAGLPGKYSIIEFEDEDITSVYSIFYNKEADKIIFIILLIDNNIDYDFKSDLDDILESARLRISGFSNKTNQNVVFHGISFSIPSYFDVCDAESQENYLHYYPEKEEYYCSLFFQVEDIKLTKQDFEKLRESMVDEILEAAKENQDKIALLDKSINIKNTDMLGCELSYISIEDDNQLSTYKKCLMYNPNLQEVIMVVIIYDSIDASQYDYFEDFDKIIGSACLITDVDNSTNFNNSNGISLEFKDAMDSYEDFFDKYIDFMQSYDSSLNMLPEYMDFMNQYTETMEKINSIDVNSLSEQEHAYYLDVMMRIDKKLLDVD